MTITIDDESLSREAKDKILQIIEKDKIHSFSKQEVADIMRETIEYMIENNELDGLAKFFSHHFNGNMRIKNSKVYNKGKEVF